MITEKNAVKNLLFEFIIREYYNKVQYGQAPTPLEYFYNHWLIDKSLETGLIITYHPPERVRKEYKDKLLDITWAAVEDLLRDRIIKRRLNCSEDLAKWDLYVPTEKGLAIWEKYGRLLIIPSNLVDSLRSELPEINCDTENVLNYLNESVSCYFQNLQLSCCLCLASATETALVAFTNSLIDYAKDPEWERKIKNSISPMERASYIKNKLKKLVNFGALISEYQMIFPKPKPDFKDEVDSFLRGIDLMINIISLTRREDNSPSLQLLKIEEVFREELVLGYLTGSYPFFKYLFIIKEVIDNINDIKKR